MKLDEMITMGILSKERSGDNIFPTSQQIVKKMLHVP